MSPPGFRELSPDPEQDAPQSSGAASKAKLRQMLADAVANTGAVKVKKAGDDRRFTDKPELDPAAVWSLRPDHPALLENRTLFPSTVVDVTEEFSDCLLVSGKNNRKLGERITKGKFKGYALYGLSLEERATCPADCGVRAFCYGNGMQMARRHRIVDAGMFFLFLESEMREILADPIDGLMVRLHVLGDFPSVEYVAFWADMLAEHDRLACYGYTHRRIKSIGGDDIGEAIDALKRRYPDRFRIRWSSDVSRPDGAVVVNRVPVQPRIKEGIVCPAQTDATACCASCGLCWESSARNDTIVFIKHGPKSDEAAVQSAVLEMKESAKAVSHAPVETLAATKQADETVRPIAGIAIPQKRDRVLSQAPEVRIVSPADLRVESAYQRDLSGRSIRLIRKIVIGWDWTKYKAPICAETEDGLFIIDGQHTAIAAASHPEIRTIPVMVVAAQDVRRRAEAFVSHNRDRLIMTPAQVFYGDVAAGHREAQAVLDSVTRAGGSIPRLPVARNYAKPGQITAVGECRKILTTFGPEMLERIIRIATLSRQAPISATVVIGLRTVLSEKHFSSVADLADVKIAAALGGVKNIEAASQHYAAETGQSRYRACAGLIATALESAGAKA